MKTNYDHVVSLSPRELACIIAGVALDLVESITPGYRVPMRIKEKAVNAYEQWLYSEYTHTRKEDTEE